MSCNGKGAFPRRFILLCKLYHIGRNFAILCEIILSLHSHLHKRSFFTKKMIFCSPNSILPFCDTYKSDFWRFGYWNNYQRFRLKMSLLHKNRLKTLIFNFFVKETPFEYRNSRPHKESGHPKCLLYSG